MPMAATCGPSRWAGALNCSQARPALYTFRRGRSALAAPGLLAVTELRGGLEAPHGLPLNPGSALEALERCDLPLEDPPHREVAQQRVHLLVRLGVDDEHERAVAKRQAAGHDLPLGLERGEHIEARDDDPLQHADGLFGRREAGPLGSSDQIPHENPLVSVVGPRLRARRRTTWDTRAAGRWTRLVTGLARPPGPPRPKAGGRSPRGPRGRTRR